MRRFVLAACVPLTAVALATPIAGGGTLQSYQATGQLGLEVSGYSNPAGAISNLSGTLSVSQIPIGAVVQKAFVYAGDWNNGNAALDLSFNFSPPITAGPIGTDAAFSTFYGYRWEVTALIAPAPMSYSFSIGQTGQPGNQMPGASLVVVWSHPGAATSTVSIVDGALQVGENTPAVADTESMTITGLPAKLTQLHLFTVSDDAAGSGEVIDYNGNPVGGPIDENLGLGASLSSIYNLTSLSPANNVVSVTSTADHFGWVYTASIVPEPATATLMLLGLAGVLAVAGRRRRRLNR